MCGCDQWGNVSSDNVIGDSQCVVKFFVPALIFHDFSAVCVVFLSVSTSHTSIIAVGHLMKFTLVIDTCLYHCTANS